MGAHLGSLTSLSRVNYVTVSSKPPTPTPTWNNIDCNTHTYTPVSSVHSPNHDKSPFPPAVPPQGVVTRVSAQMRKEATHRHGIIEPGFHVTAALFHYALWSFVTGRNEFNLPCFISPDGHLMRFNVTICAILNLLTCFFFFSFFLRC